MNRTTSMVLLDIARAFDVVWHNGLLSKIKEKFPGNIVKITQSYLHNRSYKVKINDALSDAKTIPAGVPQGGVLSPTLFQMYINDIPKNPKTQLGLFADDTALIAVSKQTSLAHKYLNVHLEDLLTYFKKWKLQINIEKTELINFTQKRNIERTTNLNAINNPPEKPTVKYLGIHLDKKLKFRCHIEHLKGKALAALRFIYPYILPNSSLSTKLKINLYKAYMKSILIYGGSIIHSALDRDLNKLAVVETKTLRTIMGRKQYEIKNKEIYEQLNAEPVLYTIHKQAQAFFDYRIKASELTESIGNLKLGEMPFRQKYKLINQRMLELDPDI